MSLAHSVVVLRVPTRLFGFFQSNRLCLLYVFLGKQAREKINRGLEDPRSSCDTLVFFFCVFSRLVFGHGIRKTLFPSTQQNMLPPFPIHSSSPPSPFSSSSCDDDIDLLPSLLSLVFVRSLSSAGFVLVTHDKKTLTHTHIHARTHLLTHMRARALCALFLVPLFFPVLFWFILPLVRNVFLIHINVFSLFLSLSLIHLSHAQGRSSNLLLKPPSHRMRTRSLLVFAHSDVC